MPNVDEPTEEACTSGTSSDLNADPTRFAESHPTQSMRPAAQTLRNTHITTPVHATSSHQHNIHHTRTIQHQRTDERGREETMSDEEESEIVVDDTATATLTKHHTFNTVTPPTTTLTSSPPRIIAAAVTSSSSSSHRHVTNEGADLSVAFASSSSASATSSRRTSAETSSSPLAASHSKRDSYGPTTIGTHSPSKGEGTILPTLSIHHQQQPADDAASPLVRRRRSRVLTSSGSGGLISSGSASSLGLQASPTSQQQQQQQQSRSGMTTPTKQVSSPGIPRHSPTNSMSPPSSSMTFLQSSSPGSSMQMPVQLSPLRFPQQASRSDQSPSPSPHRPSRSNIICLSPQQGYATSGGVSSPGKLFPALPGAGSRSVSPSVNASALINASTSKPSSRRASLTTEWLEDEQQQQSPLASLNKSPSQSRIRPAQQFTPIASPERSYERQRTSPSPSSSPSSRASFQFTSQHPLTPGTPTRLAPLVLPASSGRPRTPRSPLRVNVNVKDSMTLASAVSAPASVAVTPISPVDAPDVIAEPQPERIIISHLETDESTMTWSLSHVMHDGRPEVYFPHARTGSDAEIEPPDLRSPIKAGRRLTVGPLSSEFKEAIQQASTMTKEKVLLLLPRKLPITTNTMPPFTLPSSLASSTSSPISTSMSMNIPAINMLALSQSQPAASPMLTLETEDVLNSLKSPRPSMLINAAVTTPPPIDRGLTRSRAFDILNTDALAARLSSDSSSSPTSTTSVSGSTSVYMSPVTGGSSLANTKSTSMESLYLSSSTGLENSTSSQRVSISSISSVSAFSSTSSSTSTSSLLSRHFTIPSSNTPPAIIPSIPTSNPSTMSLGLSALQSNNTSTPFDLVVQDQLAQKPKKWTHPKHRLRIGNQEQTSPKEEDEGEEDENDEEDDQDKFASSPGGSRLPSWAPLSLSPHDKNVIPAEYDDEQHTPLLDALDSALQSGGSAASSPASSSTSATSSPQMVSVRHKRRDTGSMAMNAAMHQHMQLNTKRAAALHSRDSRSGSLSSSPVQVGNSLSSISNGLILSSLPPHLKMKRVLPATTPASITSSGSSLNNSATGTPSHTSSARLSIQPTGSPTSTTNTDSSFSFDSPSNTTNSISHLTSRMSSLSTTSDSMRSSIDGFSTLLSGFSTGASLSNSSTSSRRDSHAGSLMASPVAKAKESAYSPVHE